MRTISSKSNPYIKFVRGLRTKKSRDQSGKFYIEGIRLVEEALRSEYSLESIVICNYLLISEFGRRSVELGEKMGVDIVEVSKEVFKSFSMKERPQGISAVGVQQWSDHSTIKNRMGLWIALEGIQDPGNLGSMIRSLNGAGGEGVILVGDSTDPYHPTAVRSSTGALFTTPIVRLSTEEIIEFKDKVDIQLIGTICSEAKSFREYSYSQNMILLLGSEQKGLSESLLRICDALVTIPMVGSVDSLNIACAASIVLFEIAKHEYKS